MGARNLKMPRLLCCSQGHQWEAAEDVAAEGDSSLCPVCGVAASVLNPVPLSTGDVSKIDTSAPTIPDVPASPSGSSRATDQAPPSIPEFDILEEIGRGGMGIVYRARQHGKERIVAIKVIRKDRLQHEEAVRRFRREAHAASRLCHPNIVQVFDFDHTGDTHYLVMEYVDGITLERYAEEHGPLPIPLACDFLRQSALGLQHAHEQALVHRDIKPSNLMVAKGVIPLVKLLDMGVARVLQLGGQGPGESLSTITQGGAVIGTADYVAPEQLEDPHGADVRADIYSLGCTFYFLLTGQVPFPGGTLLSKLDKQRWHTPTAIEEIRTDIPSAVARVLRKLMEKAPADRYQTPGELGEALQQLVLHDYAEPPVPRIEFTNRRRMTGHQEAVFCVRWSGDGRHIASGGKDCQLILWDAETGKIVRSFPKQSNEIRSVAFSPTEENRLATASGLSIRLWDRGTAQEVRRFSGHTGAIKSLAFSADGKRLISGSDDKTIRLWEVQTGREIHRFARHTGSITALAIVTESNQLLSTSRDQTIRLWDLRTDREVRSFGASTGAVLEIAISSGGQRVASAHYDTILRLWDLNTGGQLGEFVGHKQMVSALAFTPDGQRLLSAGQDQTLRLWDVATFAELTSISCHTAGINALSLSPDGRHVVTASADKTLAMVALPIK